MARPAGEAPSNRFPPPTRSVACDDTDCVVVIIDTGVANPGTSSVRSVTSTAAAQAAKMVKALEAQPGGPNPGRKIPIVTCRPFGDLDTADWDDDGFFDPFSGHGSFIAGIVNRVAPNATIVSHRAMPSAGDVDDFHVGLAVDQVMARLGRLDLNSLTEKCMNTCCECACTYCTGNANDECTCVDGKSPTTADLDDWSDVPVIINLSFSGYAEDNDPPTCTAAAIAAALHSRLPDPEACTYEFADTRDVVVVASAGNSSDCRIVWPGGFDNVIAVAALDGSSPAWYSNYGPWVNACAQGSDVISNFYRAGQPAATFHERNQFSGWASWSGTSFAAPLVAAVLAQEVLTTGDSPLDAVERIIEQPELFKLLGLGTVVNTY